MKPKQLLDMGGTFLKGLMINYAPEMARGMVVELLKRPVVYKGTTRYIDTRLIVDLVIEDVSLWSLLDAKGVSMLKDTARRIGDIKWFDSDWLIDTIKEEYPALASQFLGWSKAREWLDRQFVELHSSITS